MTTMITGPLHSTEPVAGSTLVPPSRRATGAVGLLTVAAFVAAVLVAPKQDVTTSAQLHAFLEENGWRQAVAWALMLVSGLAWLGFAVGLRRLLPAGHGRDLFTAAAVAAAAASWAGVSLNTAAAVPDARGVSLPVYQAFGQAGHLAVAAGTAATGLALLGLFRAAGTARLWPAAITRATAIVGAVLVVTPVIGPVNVPTYVLWLLTVSVLLLRSAGAGPGPGEPGVRP